MEEGDEVSRLDRRHAGDAGDGCGAVLRRWQEQGKVVEEGEDEGRLGPEGDLGNPEALGQGGRPHEVGVGDEHVEGGITAAGGGELHHQLLDVGGHEVEKGVGEVVERLLVCGGGLETAVADEFVADVEAPGASAAEDVGAGAAGIEELAVEGFRGDDEAPGGKQDGEVSGGREVALEGDGHWPRRGHGAWLRRNIPPLFFKGSSYPQI